MQLFDAERILGLFPTTAPAAATAAAVLVTAFHRLDATMESFLDACFTGDVIPHRRCSIFRLTYPRGFTAIAAHASCGRGGGGGARVRTTRCRRRRTAAVGAYHASCPAAHSRHTVLADIVENTRARSRRWGSFVLTGMLEAAEWCDSTASSPQPPQFGGYRRR